MAKSDQTFYQILGLKQDATPAGISETFRHLVKEHHPDRFKDPLAKSEAESFLKDVTEAYNTLSKPLLREEYDRSLARPQSAVAQKSPQEQVRDLLQGGVARYRSGDYTSALAMLDHALRIEPGNDSALFHSGMIRLKNQRWRTQGTEQVEKAIELNPYNCAQRAAGDLWGGELSGTAIPGCVCRFNRAHTGKNACATRCKGSADTIEVRGTMTLAELRAQKRETILAIAARHGVTSIRVFGSFARGEASPESDLDLLIEAGPNRTPFFPGGFLADLEEELGRKVDVATVAALHPLIRDQVLKEAVLF